MSFARTLLRTSRALRQQSTNPIQPALGARGQTQFVNSARSYATAFERSKPHVNIGTIGHVDHGKVSSVCATSFRLKPPSPDETFADLQRPPSQPPSPSVRPRRATPPTSSMAPLTRLPRSASVVSPSPPHTSSTPPTTGITPTSTALVTPITSRT